MDDIQSWWEVPSIAHFCSLFRAAFNLLDFDIEELEEALLTDGTEDAGSSLLQELIVRLLCGCLGNNDISTFNYQMFLRRLFRQKCQEYGRNNPFNTDIDFQFLPLRTKVEILHALCDFRLDADDVQDLLKNLESDSLRVEPLGHDENHSAYWYFYGTRLYREDYPKLKQKAKDKRKKLKDEKRKKKHSRSPNESESEDCEESVWKVVCFTEEDWDRVTEGFRDSSSKVERALYHTLSEDFLPEIPRLFSEKERLQRKRMFGYQPRRQSSRLEKIKQLKEEIKQLKEKEELKDQRQQTMQTQQKELEKAKQQKDGRASRALLRSLSRTNSECGSTGSLPDSLSENHTNSSFVGRQTNNSLSSATGQIVIQGLRRKLRSSQVFRQTEEDLQTGMYKVLEHIKSHEDAWPFIDPVDEKYAPRYYSIISKPMDLQRMEDKLDYGEYLSFAEFKADFQLIVDNCRQYNGTDNEYTEMVGNLQDAFQIAVEKYLESDPSSDEEVAVEFPKDHQNSILGSQLRSQPKKEENTNEEEEEKKSIKHRSESPASVESEESADSEKDTNPLKHKSVVSSVEDGDSETNSTRDDQNGKKHSYNGRKRKKKKTGIIKNAAAIQALELATEQTLKDINKWLDDTPRFSEFSSASNSPSHYLANSTDEYDMGSRLDSELKRTHKSIDRQHRSRDLRDNIKRRPTKDTAKQHRRREIQRTIERLQPGKSKGNLITNIQTASKTEDGNLTGKPKDTKNLQSVKSDETTPKLSLGTVLASDVLGLCVGQSNHNFGVENKLESVKKEYSEEDKNHVEVKFPLSPDSGKNVELDTMVNVEKEESESKNSKCANQEKSTPNLSAWFKAFGAPKIGTNQKRKQELVSRECETGIAPEERSNSPSLCNSEKYQSVEKLITNQSKHGSDAGNSLFSKVPDENDKRPMQSPPLRSTQEEGMSPAQQVTRQRRISTGSSVSERSSFSQDMLDPLDGSSPRLSMDNYPGPYPSPLHRSPVTPSPVMASPRADDCTKLSSYQPLNGTIRAGFYQDTSSLQKGSPDKSNGSSPRDQIHQPAYPMYTPRMYPPHNDPGGYLSYQCHTTGPSSSPGTKSNFSNMPLYPSSPIMHYYDTSKPLTDQYRAARTQSSEDGISSVSSVNTTVNSTTDQNLKVPSPRPSTVTRQPSSIFPVKKRLYSEVESTISRLPPPAHASDRAPLEGLCQPSPMSCGRQSPEIAHQTTTTSILSVPEVIHKSSNICPSSPVTCSQVLPLTVTHSEDRKSIGSLPQDRLPPTTASSMFSCDDDIQVLDVLQKNKPTIARTSNVRYLDNRCIINEESSHTNPISLINSNHAADKSHHLENSISQQALRNRQLTSSEIQNSEPSVNLSNRLQPSIISTDSSERLQGNVTVSQVDSGFHRGQFPALAHSPINSLRNNVGTISHIVDRYTSEERIVNSVQSAYYEDKSLSSHIFQSSASTTLQTVVPPSSVTTTIFPQHSSSILTSSYNRNNPMVSSPISYNQSEISAPVSGKVEETQSFHRSDVSAVLPPKVTTPMNMQTAFNRNMSDFPALLSNKTSSPLNVQSAFNRSVTDLASILPNKGTSPIDLQVPFSHGVTDLSTMLSHKVPHTPPISVPSTYSHQISDFSVLTNKTPVTSEAPSAPKSSRKRKTKVAVSNSDVQVVNSTSGSTAFQQYVGLKSDAAVSEPSPIALKTSSIVPGSAFNFGPAPAGLGLYADKDSYTSYLDDYRTAPTGYYMTAPDSTRDKMPQSSSAASPFTFLSHPQPRPPTYPPLAQAFINHQPGLVDATGGPPLYQQYELLRHSGSPMVLHQGLLGPPTAFPAGYHPALGIRQPYDSMNRPSWL